MADYVDQEWLDPHNPENDRSRYAVDGGVLANTPLRHALKAIRQQEVSQTLVRRVLVLVHPHAVNAGEVVIPPDSAESPPTLVSGLAGVMGASSSVGSLSYVEEVHKHNEQALRARNGRNTTLTELESSTHITIFLDKTWPLIRRLRLQRAAFVMAEQIMDLDSKDTIDVPLARATDYARALLEDEDRANQCLPFLPAEAPQADQYQADEWRWGLDLAIGITTLATEQLRSVIAAQRKLPDSGDLLDDARAAWQLAANSGIELAELGQNGRDEDRRARGNPDVDPKLSARKRMEIQLMSDLRNYRTRMGPPEDPASQGDSEQQQPDPTGRPRRRLPDLIPKRFRNVEAEATAEPAPEEHDPRTKHHGTRVMEILDKVSDALYDVILKLNALQPATTGALGDSAGKPLYKQRVSLLHRNNPLRSAVGDSADGKTKQSVRELLCTMHRIELISYSLSEQDLAESSHSGNIEFAQLSAQIKQDFADSFSSDDKLAGMSLNRFGAFLKRSWRANDWIWGRLDAIKLMMLLTLTPQAVRGMCQCPEWNGLDPLQRADKLIEKVSALTAPTPDEQTYQCFVKMGELQTLREDAILQVVEALKGDDAPLTHVASLAAYGFQIRAAEEDVPWLAGTIRDDEADGGSGFQTTAFLHRLRDLDQRVEKSHTPRGYKLLTLFVESKIGQEALSEQLPTDLMIRTAATTAAATVTALSSDRSGVGVARPLTKGARGMVALPYWVLFGLTQRGQLGRALSAATLAFGVALLALALMGDLPGVLATIVPTVGAASLLTVLVYAAFRTQSIVHSAALLGLFIPITAFCLYRISVAKSGGQDSPDIATDALSQSSTLFIVLCLALVIGGAILVANMRTHTKTPFRSVREFAISTFHALKAWITDPWRIVRTLVFAATIAVMVWLVAAQRESMIRAWKYFRSHLWSDVAEHWGWALLGAAGIALIGGAVAFVKAAHLRPRPVEGRQRVLTDPAGIATAWAPVYGFLYLVLAVVIVTIHGDDRQDWAWTSFVLSAAFGLFFCLVLVFLVPAQRQRRLIARLVARYGPGQMPTDNEFPMSELEKLGELSSYLTNADGSALSPQGKRVLRRARRQHQSKYKHYPKPSRVTSTTG